MAFKPYDANFISVLPKMRAHEYILADITLSVSGRATDVHKGNVARIEMMIKTGDSLSRRRQYEPALNQFRQARAEIYSLLHPIFDASAYLLQKDIALPVSKALENSLLTLSGTLANAIRPTENEAKSRWRINAGDPVPDTLTSFTRTGFRESVTSDEALQSAAAAGVALLSDNKPEAAIDVMLNALAQPGTPNQPADVALTAALHLNLATAYLQSSEILLADKMATKALQLFRSAADMVGQAQALHASAVAAQRSGDPAKAITLFARAAETLNKATGPAAPEALPLALEQGSLVRANLFASALGTRDTKVLQPIANMDGRMLTVRVPGRTDGWAAIPALDDLQRKQQIKPWSVGIPAGEGIAVFKVGSGAVPTGSDLKTNLYESRVRADRALMLNWPVVNTSTLAFYLTQFYAYTLPTKIADCYNQLGQYAKAEEYYQQAALYTYLNPEAEAASLWIRMARNAVEWGDSLYKLEDLNGAKAQYSKLVLESATVPNSFLYTTPSLVNPTNAAKALIQGIATRPLPAVNWEIIYVLLTAFAQLQQIAQGLDFFGLLLSPIHTFEYLQSVARAFAQESIQAEREFVNFKSRQENEETTRRDLEMTRAMAQAEADGRFQQYVAAQEDEAAAENARKLAIKRRDDAIAQRTQYSAASSTQIWSQAAAQAVGMGEDAWYGEISELADKLARGESISGPRGKVAAAVTLYGGRKTREYELKKMQDNIDELNRGIAIATDQHDAAVKRTSAAEIAWEAAKQRAQMISASLEAFDAEFFTPETWSKMADVMRDIAGNYLYRAIRIGKLMERAYNFENDTDLRIIKNDYGQGVATPAPGRDAKLLGGDSLLQDIESFTYTAIATKTRKNSRIKDMISLASIFPAQFEQFRQTGLLSFETDLYEFDRLHPGFYGQRIEAVELEIVGLLPETGLNGTLSAGGVTSFRRRDNTAGRRVHQVDTMALSSFLLRNDMFLYGTDTGVRGLFQGIGLGSTWQLHLPKRANDFDFRRIFDVNLIVYYNAKFDLGLRGTVLALPPRPGEMALLRNFALRQDFPDAWYGFYRNGGANVLLERTRLPANQINFNTKAMHFRVMTRPGVSNANIQLRVTAPNGNTGTAATDTTGVVSTELPALATLAGLDPLGTWAVEVLGGPSLMDGAALKFDRVYNLQVGLEYSFDYAAEVV